MPDVNGRFQNSHIYIIMTVAMREPPRGIEGWRYGPPKLNRQSSAVACLFLMSLRPPFSDTATGHAIKKGAYRPSLLTRRVSMRLRLPVAWFRPSIVSRYRTFISYDDLM